MSLLLIYLLVVIGFAVASFSALSRGSFFREKAKALILIIAILVLIVMCILATIWYSWFHIIGLIVTGVLSAWIFAFIWKKTIFKNLPY